MKRYEDMSGKNTTINNKKFSLKVLGKGVIPMLIALIVLVIISAIMSPSFLRMTNVMNVLRQVSTNGIIAIGMTLVILTGGIDLTVGSVVALVVVVVASMAKLPAIVGALAGLGIGAVCGFINGMVIHKRGMQPFIVTLAMMQIVRGAAMLYSGGSPISGLAKGLGFLGSGYLGPVPFPAILMIVLFAIAWFITKHTYYGRSIYAIGGNELAATLSGTKAGRVKVSVYVISGICAAISGLVTVSRLQAGEPTAGQSWEMDAIASVVIGGTSMTGGVGNIVGTFIGVLILGILNNMFNLLNINAYLQDIVKGVIIMGAVWITMSKKKS